MSDAPEGNDVSVADTIRDKEAVDAVADLAIAVIVPSFNPGKFLHEAIESALKQFGPHDEMIIQDAGSDDGSLERLTSYDRDNRVHLYVEQDSGQSDALNKALNRVNAPWTLWLNADDVVHEGALQALRSVIAADPTVDVIAGAHHILRSDGSIVDLFEPRRLTIDNILSRGCAAFSGSLLIRTSLLRELGGFETDLNTVMDLALQLRIADSGAKQTLIQAPIGALRFHETSKSANLWTEFGRESHRVRMRYARTRKLRFRVYSTTLIHYFTRPVFRLRLRPEYRAIRRRLISGNFDPR